MTEIEDITTRIDAALARLAEFNKDLGGSEKGRTPRCIYLDQADMREFARLKLGNSYRGLEVRSARDWINGSRVFNKCGHPFTITKVKA